MLPRMMAATALALAALGVAAGAASAAEVEIVSQGEPPAVVPKKVHYFSTIQAAVDATKRGAWVLIEPGVYKEEVVVAKSHRDIHIRGMNRNSVVLDGTGLNKPNGMNGILATANEVWIENLTAKNFERDNSKGEPDSEGGGGNAIWWTSEPADEHPGQRGHGWWGKYLTAYDTGLDGGYGIFTQHETEGSWEDIYASGYNDSGIYLGACWECQARISKATIEDNAVGYSGSNSGGTLVIEKSTFRNNSSGIAPNSEVPGDEPPPSDGACNETRPKTPYRTFTSTNIARCEIFKENLITENNNLETPVNPSTEIAPWGVGVLLPGTMAIDVEDNTITNNVNNGVLGFEYPNPYPPCGSKEYKEHKCNTRTIYFQFTGNRVADNTFENNGTDGQPYNSELMMQGGIFPYKGYTSDNDCAIGNTYVGLTTSTFPENLEGTWSCNNNETPPPNNGLGAISYVERLSLESGSAMRKIKAAPAPPEQETMPEPCEDVPLANALCPKA